MPWNFSQLGKIRAGGGQRLPPLFHYPAPGTVRHVAGRPASLKIMALPRFDRYRQGDLLGWKSQRLAWPVLTDFPPDFPLVFPLVFPLGQSRGERVARAAGSPLAVPLGCLFGGVLVSTGWQEVQIACRGWSAGHVKSRPSFNCRSSVFSGCLVKQPRAMAPVGRASQSVAKSDSLCFTAGYGQG